MMVTVNITKANLSLWFSKRQDYKQNFLRKYSFSYKMISNMDNSIIFKVLYMK